METNFAKLMPLLNENENFKKGDVHQALMDIAYDVWNEHDDPIYAQIKEIDKQLSDNVKTITQEERTILYKQIKELKNQLTNQDPIAYIEEQFGAIVVFAIMTGNFNYQVCNGGIIQYYENGYGDIARTGCFHKHDPEMPMLDYFKEYIRNLHLDKPPIGEKVYDILNRIHIAVDEERTIEEKQDCCYCDGSGFNAVEKRSCRECNGKGYIIEQIDNPDYGTICNEKYIEVLDEKYYEVNEEWMEMLNRFFGIWISYKKVPIPNSVAKELLASGKYKKVS